jgi:hypothetical protein
MVASWCIWNHRNDIIFDNVSLSLVKWRSSFKEELETTLARLCRALGAGQFGFLCHNQIEVLVT